MSFKKALITLVLLIPILVFVNWKSQDFNYPSNDEAAYFDLTQKLYLNFQNGNTLEAVKSLYTEKYWKPILHPTLGVGFLALSGGDTRLAISFYGGTMYLVLLLGVFFYLKRHTSSASAAVAASTLVLLPWVYGMSTTFNSEIGFSAIAIWFYYYAEDYRDFSDLKKSVGLAFLLFLLFILRPVEAALLSCVWLIYLIGRHLKNKQIGFVDLLVVLLWVSLFLVITVFPFFILKKHWSSLQMWAFVGLAFGVLAISALSVIFGKANKAFQVFVSSFFFLSVIWYIPGSYQLFDWIYITNFDYLAKATGNRLGRPAYEFALFYLKKWGWLPVLLVLVFLIENRSQLLAKRVKAIWFLLAAIVIIPSLGGVLSYNGDVRYYYAGWLVFTAVLLAEFLKNEGFIRKLKTTFLIFILGSFSYSILKYESIEKTWLHKYFHTLGGESFFLMIPNKEDLPSVLEEKIATALEEKKEDGKLKNIHYFQTSANPFFDSNSANIIARDRNHKLFFTARSIHEPLKKEDITNTFVYSDFILVGSIFVTQEINSNSEPRNKLAELCVKQQDQDNIFSQQLKFYKEVRHDSTYWPAARFCLFEVVR